MPPPRSLWKIQAGCLLGALLSCSSTVTAEARLETLDMARLSFDISPLESGWQPNTVTSVIQSQDGYLWLGTYNGLVRFDGVRLTIFDSSNPPGLRNSRITSLHEAPQRLIWIGNETGELTRFDKHGFQPVSFPHPWPGGAIESITTDEKNDLWLLNDRGLLFRLRDGIAAESPGSGSAAQKVLLIRSTNAQIWLAASGKVATLEHGQVVPYKFNGRNDADFYQAVFPSRKEGLWVIVNGEVRRFKEGHWEVLKDNPAPQSPVTCLLETRSGSLLAGTLNDGLYLFGAGASPIHFNRTNGLSHDWVRCLCEDHEGNVSIGTGAGLDTLRVRKVKMLNAPDSWQGRAVLSFAVHSDGSAWVGTEGAGLYHFQNGKWNTFTEASGLANLFVWSVLETRAGQLFVGTWGGGLLLKNGDRFESEGELSKINAPIVSMFEGSKGEVWIGTTMGLYRYEAGQINWFAGKEKLFLPDVRAITESSDCAL